MKFIIALIIAFTPLSYWSQEPEIGESIKNIGAIKEIHVLNENEILTTSIKQRIGRNKIVLEHFKNNIKLKEVPTPYRVNRSLGKFEDFILVDGKGYAFISDQAGKARNLYISPLNLEDGEFGNSKFLIEDPIPRNRQAPSAFQYAVSKNKKFLAVLVNTTLKDEKEFHYRYVIMDGKGEKVTEGSFKLNSEKELTKEFEFTVTNDKSLIVFHKEVRKESSGLFNSKVMLVSSHIYCMKKDFFKHINLNSEDDNIAYELDIVENDSTYYLHGFYQKSSLDAMNNKLQGVFFKRLDNQFKIEKSTYTNFPTNILLIGFTEEEVKNQREDLAMRSFVVRNTLLDTTSRSIFGLSEQFYTLQESYPDSRGYLRTVTSYYYNDILSYKFNYDGELIWMNKSPKIQTTINDRGYFSGYYSYLNNEGNPTVIFNDNKANYLEDGSYKDPLKRKELAPKRSAYTTTKLILDKDNGDKNFTEFIDEFERNYHLIPRMTRGDTSNNFCIMMIEGKTKTNFVKLVH